MTPQESRERYIDSLFSIDEVLYLKQIGLYDKYVTGEIDIQKIYTQLKDQGV
jgi:hypothetical protein